MLTRLMEQDSQPPQAVYLNAATGVLSYLPSGTSNFPAGANAVNFVHLGQGTSVTTPQAGTTDYANAGPGSFNWIGSPNDYWFLCARPVSAVLRMCLEFVMGEEEMLTGIGARVPDSEGCGRSRELQSLLERDLLGCARLHWEEPRCWELFVSCRRERERREGKKERGG